MTFGYSCCCPSPKEADVAAAQPRILIVAPTITLTNSLQLWLREARYEPVVVRTFPAAKAALRNLPDLLITEVRLADYNGLHLAMHAQTESIPAIVLGGSDATLEADAKQFGAAYVKLDDVSRETMLQHVERLCADAAPRYRSQDFAASDLEWVVAPEVMHDRGTLHTRRMTHH